MVEPVEPVADQDPMGGRGVQANDAGDASRSEAPISAQGDHPTLQTSFELVRTVMWTRGTVLEAVDPLLLIAAPPDVGPIS